MTGRAAALRVHLLLALSTGALTLLLGASGAVLVFRDELEAALVEPLPRVTPRPARADLQALVDAAQRAQPAWRPRALLLPDAADQAARVAMAGRPGEEPEVLVDPYSGAVLRTRWRERSPLHALRLLHAELYLGAPGGAVVGALGVAFAVQGLTGLYLWWPFARRPARGVAVRWRRTWPVLAYDVHKAVGVVSLAFNVPIALTGAVLALAAASAGAAPAPTGAEPAPGLALDATAARALAAVPGTVRSIELSAAGHAVVRVRVPGDLDPRGSGLAMIAAGGQVITARGGPHTPAGARLWAIVPPLHHGDFGGRPSKLLYLAFGLSGPALVVTGYAVWLARRGRATRGRPSGATGATGDASGTARAAGPAAARTPPA